MSPFNRLMNHAAELTHSDSFFKRQLASRVEVLAGGVPLELLTIVQNVIKLPFEGVLSIVKLPAKVLNLCLDSQTFKEFEFGLPGPLDFIKTAFKIVGYAIGSVFTATLGFISPINNFYLHTALGLITNEKAEAVKKQAFLEATRLQEDQKKATETHIQSLILAMRRKYEDKERWLAEEVKKRIDAEEAAKVKIEEEKKELERKMQQVQFEMREIYLKEAADKAMAIRIEEESRQKILSTVGKIEQANNDIQISSKINQGLLKKPFKSKEGFMSRIVDNFKTKSNEALKKSSI